MTTGTTLGSTDGLRFPVPAAPVHALAVVLEFPLLALWLPGFMK